MRSKSSREKLNKMFDRQLKDLLKTGDKILRDYKKGYLKGTPEVSDTELDDAFVENAALNRIRSNRKRNRTKKR